MKWKCMFCDKKATMHLKEIVNLKPREVHLCEGCARERNLLPDPPGPQIDLKALMNLLMPPVHIQSGAATASEPLCPKCGLTYGTFKAEGRFGCEHDYEAFRSILEPILERIHRAVSHTGKMPVAARLAARIQELQMQMKAAVEDEDYEQAARLRDLIRQQEAEGTLGMNLDVLLPNLGEWLRGTGPESDVVVSTRIRLARNLADFPFTNRASNAQKADIVQRSREAIAKANLQSQLEYLDVPTMPALDRQFLVERQLISRELAAVLDGPRGVAFDPKESISVMINEEDHLRLQVLRSGFALEEAWADIDMLDDALEARLSYAFHSQFGYMTACPTNVGTGLRASVMLHLPALGLTKQIEKVFRALQKINLAVRGLHGEGSRAFGDLYQISNQVTLGKPESKILGEIQEVIQTILQYERQARTALMKERRKEEQDRVARALGTLSSATMITAEETMELLSVVRLGIHLRLIDDVPATTVNQLFIQTQAAHLQKLVGHSLDGEERNAARAKYLKTRLREIGSHRQ